MSEPRNDALCRHPRWLRFALKCCFVIALAIACFFGERASRQPDIQLPRDEKALQAELPRAQVGSWRPSVTDFERSHMDHPLTAVELDIQLLRDEVDALRTDLANRRAEMESSRSKAPYFERYRSDHALHTGNVDVPLWQPESPPPPDLWDVPRPMSGI